MNNPHKAAAEFVEAYRHLEFALKRSDYGRKDKEYAEVDWAAFAKDLGPEFFNHVQSAGLAKTLIGSPPRRQMADLVWSPDNPPPLTNVTELMINGVCRVRNSYIHGEKFTGGPDGQWERDQTLLEEAHAVLREAVAWKTNSAHS